ncbi:RHS repeat-associated core domain-containing protein [Pseudomonas soli]|uniref:RHS repeat-associated core domain-containing protein n=2 Tax=Pseudomonas soli TaxID=1306993 RepID=A0A1H9MD83_9PSED|nr:RHS repeat-associated core domain-containing protein [Pseudomonas soli]SER21656.1 RHS repeat-associated core domain-containing protein [Pseudomonas soli]
MSSTLLAVDRLHSPLARFGACTSTAAYLPHGYKHGLTAKPSLGFTGQLCEPAVGFYLLGNGHRIYNTVLKCFHSPDRLSPFGKGGINTYAYCSRDPVNRTDPSGRLPMTAPVTSAVNVIVYATGAKITFDGINMGLKHWRSEVTGAKRPWTDPLKLPELVSQFLKVSTITLLGASELRKFFASKVTDPENMFQQSNRDDDLTQALIVKAAAAATGTASVIIETFIAGVDLDRARMKNNLNKNMRSGEDPEAGHDFGAAADIAMLDTSSGADAGL